MGVAQEQPYDTAPLNLECSGLAREAANNGSLLNVPYTFRLAVWQNPWRATYNGRPIKDLVVTDNAVTFTPPSASPMNTAARAYSDILTLGMSARSRVIRLDRQTGSYQSGYVSGECRLVRPDQRLF